MPNEIPNRTTGDQESPAQFTMGVYSCVHRLCEPRHRPLRITLFSYIESYLEAVHNKREVHSNRVAGKYRQFYTDLEQECGHYSNAVFGIFLYERMKREDAHCRPESGPGKFDHKIYTRDRPRILEQFDVESLNDELESGNFCYSFRQNR